MIPGTLAPPPAQPAASADGSHTRVLTGEAVHLDMRVAGLGSRALARLIDAVIQLVLTYVVLVVLEVIVLLLASTGLIRPDTAVSTAVLLVGLVITLLGYSVFFETLTRGRTPGKLMFGLRVVRDDGGPVTARQALTRALVGFAIEWPGLLLAPLTWIATVWVMATSRQGKRLGDHVAGTMVIHERTPTPWGWVPAMPPTLAGWAGTLDLAGLDDELAMAVRDFLARSRQVTPAARAQLAQRLAREVGAVTNPPPPAGTPLEVYLAAVHAERHRRAMNHLAAVRLRSATVWADLASAIAVPATAKPSAATPSAPTPPAANTPPAAGTLPPYGPPPAAYGPIRPAGYPNSPAPQ